MKQYKINTIILTHVVDTHNKSDTPHYTLL